MFFLVGLIRREGIPKLRLLLPVHTQVSKSHPIYSHGLAPCVNKMFVQKYFLTVSVWVKKCHESFKQSVMVSYLCVEIPSYIVYSIYICILQYENACVSISICSSYILKCFTLLSKHASKS